MMVRRRARLITGVAVAATAASLSLSALALAQSTDAQTAHARLNPLSTIDPSSLKGFLETPLFSPSRKAPEAPALDLAAAAPAPLAAPPSLRLLGILETPQGAVARIIDLTTNASLALRTGDTVGDLVAASIGKSSLLLTHGDKQVELRIFQPAETLPAAPPGPAPEAPLLDAPTDVRVIDGATLAPGADTGAAASHFTAEDLRSVFGDGPRDVAP